MRIPNDPLMPRNSRGTQFTPFFYIIFLADLQKANRNKLQKKKNTKNSKYTIKMLQQESNWTTSTLIYPPEPFHCLAFLSYYVMPKWLLLASQLSIFVLQKCVKTSDICSLIPELLFRLFLVAQVTRTFLHSRQKSVNQH